jgi:hypothetical protein
MSGQDDKELQEGFRDVLDGLSRLAGRMRQERYPGLAWPARRQRRIRLLHWPVLAAAAAAAAVFLAVVLRLPHAIPKVDQVGPSPVASAPAGTQEKEITWSIPTEIDVSVAGQVSLEIPTLSIPSLGDASLEDANGFGWAIPAISFPSLEERSSNHDS